MRKLVLVAGLAAAALVPSFAFAQSSCEQQRDSHVTGTLAGAGIGALLGSAIAPRGDKAAGAVIGAVGGGVIGNQATRPDADCAHAYGYYDRDNRWHANVVGAGMARGYYDHQGDWVDGAPNGAYDRSNHWVASTASGYYDDTGRWVAGPVSGAYDARGHWMAGAVDGHRDAGGGWVTDAQPGYYDGAGHWRAGQVQGRYNERGVWISSDAGGGGFATDASYPQPRRDLDTRAAWLEQRIRAAAHDGALGRRAASRALRELDGVRRQESDLRDAVGRLSHRDEAMLQARLDRLAAGLNLPRTDGRDAL
jgi:hypothetical protein